MGKQILIIDEKDNKLMEVTCGLIQEGYEVSTLNYDNIRLLNILSIQHGIILLNVTKDFEGRRDLIEFRNYLSISRKPLIVITEDQSLLIDFENTNIVSVFMIACDNRTLINFINEYLLAKVVRLYEIIGGGLFVV